VAIFSVTDRWGDEIVLWEEDWARITAKRPDVAPHVEEVRRTLEKPAVVYEGKWPDSKVFYARDLLRPPFGDCYVAVVVRYNVRPATLRTVYFPFEIRASLGTLLYIER
jgi:hypothetical protein